MNFIGLIVLFFLLFDTIIGVIADMLNLKHLKKEIPEEMTGVYNHEKYAKSQEYLKERTRFGIVNSFFGLLLILAFWFLRGFEILDLFVRDFGFSQVWSGIIYIAILYLAYSIITIPFSLYGTFIIEEKFGFNKTTPKTWVIDKIKGLGLFTVIGLPLLGVIFYIFISLGDLAWLYGWALVVGFSFIMQYIAPTWIMPLFNTFTPIKEGELYDKITAYAQKVDFPLTQIFEIDGSKRSAKSNAFFTGFGKNKRIALFDTLIENHTTDELLAVVAHEVGHYKKRHILKSQIISVLNTGVLFFLLGISLNYMPLFEAFFVSETSVYLGFIFFGLLYQPVQMLLSIFMQVLSRKHEYEADAWATSTTGEKQPMIDALKKLSVDNLSNLTPHPFYVFVNYSHPPVLQRIKAIKEL